MTMTDIGVDSPIDDKVSCLQQKLKEANSAVIAFSGGVDSTVLSAVATEMLGKKAICVLASSQLVPERDLNDARHLADEIRLNLVEINWDPMVISEFTGNGKDRCYYCKRAMILRLRKLADEMVITTICEGSNFDDLSEFRPGLKAVAEVGCRSLLAESCLTKSEIRSIAHNRGLKNWDRPPAPCLASRIPYGMTITGQIVKQIDRGEDLIKGFGIKQVRLRHHNDIARIEVGQDDITLLLQNSNVLVDGLKKLGYRYITVDIEGFRSGSLDELLQNFEQVR